MTPLSEGFCTDGFVYNIQSNFKMAKTELFPVVCFDLIIIYYICYRCKAMAFWVSHGSIHLFWFLVFVDRAKIEIKEKNTILCLKCKLLINFMIIELLY